MSTMTDRPWVATDEDCETGYLIGAPEGLTPDEALALFLRTFRANFGGVKSVDGEPLAAELRGFREPRSDEPFCDDAALVACAPGDDAEAMIWVVEGIEWTDTDTTAPAAENQHPASQ